MASTRAGHDKSNVPEVCFCEEKHRLMQLFTEAVQEFVALQDQQTAAVIAGEPDFSRFDPMLHSAGEKKDHAKYSLLAHIEAHHC